MGLSNGLNGVSSPKLVLLLKFSKILSSSWFYAFKTFNVLKLAFFNENADILTLDRVFLLFCAYIKRFLLLCKIFLLFNILS